MGRTILFPADLPPILMVPPQEHCQGERSSPQFQTQNSLWCASRPLAASSHGWCNQTDELPVPKAHLPAGASVQLEMRTETLEKHFKRWACGSPALQTWWPPEEGTCLDSTMALWIQGFTIHIGCKWLRSHSALGSRGAAGTHSNTKEAGGTKLNPLVSRDTWDLRAAWAISGCVATS